MRKLNSKMTAGADAPSMTSGGYLKTVKARGRRRLRLNTPGFSLKRERPQCAMRLGNGATGARGILSTRFGETMGRSIPFPLRTAKRWTRGCVRVAAAFWTTIGKAVLEQMNRSLRCCERDQRSATRAANPRSEEH